jgi:hypothetical protein
MAGAATSVITPEIGGEIVGGFSPFPSTHIHDDLHARCLVLDDGKTKIAIVVCDLLALHRSVAVEARKLIEQSTGIPAGNVAISCTHTHSATSALGPTPRTYKSDMELDDYQRFVARRIADGVKRAANNLRPAQVGFGTVDVPDHVHNRRWHMKEGTSGETARSYKTKATCPSFTRRATPIWRWKRGPISAVSMRWHALNGIPITNLSICTMPPFPSASSITPLTPLLAKART